MNCFGSGPKSNIRNWVNNSLVHGCVSTIVSIAFLLCEKLEYVESQLGRGLNVTEILDF